MLLRPVDIVDDISPEEFKTKYFQSQVPVVIRNLAKRWDAYHKWDWDYFKTLVGNEKVGI